MERRQFFTADAKFAATEDATHPRRLSGYALVWGVTSSDRGGYLVRLAKGSARFATPTLALYRHDKTRVLANTANDTLKLVSDEIGVKFEADLPDTQDGRDVFTLVKGGYVRGMSFAMADAPKGAPTREAGQEIYDATDYLVDEISVLVDPAFVQAHVDTFSARNNQALRLALYRLHNLKLPAGRGR